jgi:hypothetical protein
MGRGSVASGVFAVGQGGFTILLRRAAILDRRLPVARRCGSIGQIGVPVIRSVLLVALGNLAIGRPHLLVHRRLLRARLGLRFASRSCSPP